MAKTAEEIINSVVGQSNSIDRTECTICMSEWGDIRVAQEVEAYRQRIKDGIAEQFFKRTSLSFGEIKSIIDAVK